MKKTTAQAKSVKNPTKKKPSKVRLKSGLKAGATVERR